eukprot:863246-Pelagomonas_calceolata.AAC.3
MLVSTYHMQGAASQANAKNIGAALEWKCSFNPVLHAPCMPACHGSQHHTPASSTPSPVKASLRMNSETCFTHPPPPLLPVCKHQQLTTLSSASPQWLWLPSA